MNSEIISEIFSLHFRKAPEGWERCAVGMGNFVCIVNYRCEKYVLRCSEKMGAYRETVRWLDRLHGIGVPVPEALFGGRTGGYDYIILTYIEGNDIGLVYGQLSREEKRGIAREVIRIQQKVSQLPVTCGDGWDWNNFIDDMLETAEERIVRNGYFDRERVCALRKEKRGLRDYFDNVRPAPYLDDISTKNLLIHEGKISGIIDVDNMGMGDSLTFIALTYVALLNDGNNTDYAEFLLEERGCTEIEMRTFYFYSLMYCVDFMGERGCVFGDKRVAVNEKTVSGLNGIYDMLWEKWQEGSV